MPKIPRTNKSKEEIVAKIEQDQKIAHMVALTKLMWPAVEQQETIYDTQTTLRALAGYIDLGIHMKEEEIKVGDLSIDFSKEKDSPIKHAMTNIQELLRLEGAYSSSALLKKIADHIGQFGASEFVKGPMSGLKITDIVI